MGTSAFPWARLRGPAISLGLGGIAAGVVVAAADLPWVATTVGFTLAAIPTLTALTLGRTRGTGDATSEEDRLRGLRSSQEQVALSQGAVYGTAVGHLGQELLRTTRASDFYDHSVRVIAETLEVEMAAVFEREGDGHRLRRMRAFGVPESGETGFDADEHSRLRPLFGQDEAWVILVRQLREIEGPLSAGNPDTGLLASIPGRDRPRGLVWAASASPRAFTETDRIFLQIVANLIASAMDRAESEEQLRQAQKMEVVGRVAGGIAHDFNNLLTGILGSAKLLEMGVDDPKLREELTHEISLAANRAALLTRRLLTFSRKQNTAPHVLDVNGVVSDFAPMLKRIVGDRVRLDLNLAKDTLNVWMDRGNLEQVLLNLVVNARDATQRRGGQVQIRTQPAGSTVEICVVDDGVGMDERVRARAFEPFFTTKEAEKGTGLGLATVQRLVHEADGQIRVESAPEHGSTFTVVLPASEEKVQVPSVTHDPIPRGRADRQIVVVEDNEIVLRVATEILLKAGYKVKGTADTDEARNLITNTPTIHLVLSDIVMPKMSGYELAQWLQNNRPEVPVLLMTGHSEESLAAPPGLRHLEILRKPFTPRDLLERIHTALQAGADPADRAPATQ